MQVEYVVEHSKEIKRVPLNFVWTLVSDFGPGGAWRFLPNTTSCTMESDKDKDKEGGDGANGSGGGADDIVVEAEEKTKEPGDEDEPSPDEDGEKPAEDADQPKKPAPIPPVTNVGAVRVLLQADGSRQVEQLSESVAPEKNPFHAHMAYAVTETHSGIRGAEQLRVRIDLDQRGPNVAVSVRASFRAQRGADVDAIEDEHLKPAFRAYVSGIASLCA